MCDHVAAGYFLLTRSQSSHTAASPAARAIGREPLVQLGSRDARAVREIEPRAGGRRGPQPQRDAEATRRGAPARSRRGPGVPGQLQPGALGFRLLSLRAATQAKPDTLRPGRPDRVLLRGVRLPRKSADLFG